MLMFSIFCPLLCGNQIKDIQQHLKECKKKNLLNKYYFQCPFNPNHIISKNVFPYHKENCPDKKANTEIDNIVDNSELEEFKKNTPLLIKKNKSEKEIKLKENNLENKKEKKKIEKYNSHDDISPSKSARHINLNFDIFDRKLKRFEEREGSFYSENTDISYDNSLKNTKRPLKQKISFDNNVKVFVYQKELLYSSRFQRHYNDHNDETFIKKYNKYL